MTQSNEDRPPATPQLAPAPFLQLILGFFLVVAFCLVVWLVFPK